MYKQDEEIYNNLESYSPSYLEPDKLSYVDESKERGKDKLIVFNLTEFSKKEDAITDGYLERREGGDNDAKVLIETFTKLGFECMAISDPINLTKNKIFEYIINDSEQYACFCVAVLTHGEHGYLHAYDEKFKEEELFNYISEIKANVKLCIIQACRIILEADNNAETPSMDLLSLPLDNMIVFHSQYSFKAALRHIRLGTPFIQILCKRLSIMKEKNSLLDEFAFVIRDVGNVTCGKQTPVLHFRIDFNYRIGPIDSI